MFLREYAPSDTEEVINLFRDTVRSVNSADYTREQVEAWAPQDVDARAWRDSFRGRYAVVAVENDVIVGFGDIDETGYLDRLYVHKDHQRKGIATAICNDLERAVCGSRITVHASLTAKPFFEKRGYRTLKEQSVERRGVLLTNFVMEKV